MTQGPPPDEHQAQPPTPSRRTTTAPTPRPSWYTRDARRYRRSLLLHLYKSEKAAEAGDTAAALRHLRAGECAILGIRRACSDEMPVWVERRLMGASARLSVGEIAARRARAGMRGGSL